MEPICRLCGAAPAIKNSHVVPEFMYKEVYDAKHRFMPFSTEDFKQPKISQLGYREALLCLGCENRFSKWEAQLKLLVDALMIPPAHGMNVIHDAGNILVYDGVRYDAIKRAVLSIVWRMSIADKEPWQAYALGPHEEKLRLRLLSDDPIGCEVYPTTISVVKHEGKTVPGLMLLYKEPTRMDGLSGHTFIAHGVMFTMFITETEFPSDLCGGVLNETGYLPVPVISLTEIATKDLHVDLNSSFNAKTKQFHKKK